MQRAPCSRCFSSPKGSYISNQSLTRSSTLRRLGCSRSISRKPVSLPMLYLLCRRHQRRRSRWTGSDVDIVGARHVEHALVLVRKDLDEAHPRLRPVLENPGGSGAAGVFAMALEQAADFGDIFVRAQRLQVDHGLVAAPC